MARSRDLEVEFDAQALLDFVERERCGLATAYLFDTSKEFRVTCIGRRRVLPNDGQSLDERLSFFRCELGRGREQLLDACAGLGDHDQNVALGGRPTPPPEEARSVSVLLVSDRAAARAFYEWQYSADGGKTWLAAGSTLKTSTTVPGLTPGASVMFRYRAGTKTGEGDWSQTATIIIK